MRPKSGVFKTMYAPKINMNGSTHIVCIAYIVYKAKSQAGVIRVKYIMATQKGQSRKKINQES